MSARLAIALVLIAACGPHSISQSRPIVDRVPPHSELDGYRGKVLVLDFWATWCAECVRTIPQVQRLAAAFDPAQLAVVGVNAGESAEVARAAAARLGIEYPIVIDGELALSDQLAGGKLPQLVVVDRKGNVVHRTAQVDAATLAKIRALLAR